MAMPIRRTRGDGLRSDARCYRVRDCPLRAGWVSGHVFATVPTLCCRSRLNLNLRPRPALGVELPPMGTRPCSAAGVAQDAPEYSRDPSISDRYPLRSASCRSQAFGDVCSRPRAVLHADRALTVLTSSPVTTSADARSMATVGEYIPSASSIAVAVMGPNTWKATARLASSLPSAQIKQK